MRTSDNGQDRPASPLPDHPVRIALLDLLAEAGTVTSTEAARRLGYSSGLCSFHLRQLARYRLIEEAPHPGGRARPWRLRWETWDGFPQVVRDAEPGAGPGGEASFSAVLHVTPEESRELTARIRELLDPYRDPRGRPAAAVPVTAALRWDATPDRSSGTHARGGPASRTGDAG